jgi:hypothetical protein
VAKAAGHSSEVDARGEQLGRGVVPKGMQVAVDAHLGAHARIAVADPARVVGPVVRNLVREQKVLVGRFSADLAHKVLVPLAVFGQHVDRRGVQRDSAHLMGLGVLFDRLSHDPQVVSTDGEVAGRQVDI